jgi:hypothetical protein
VLRVGEDAGVQHLARERVRRLGVPGLQQQHRLRGSWLKGAPAPAEPPRR